MPLLIQLLAGLPLKNKKLIPLPRVKSFWPSWVQFNVAAGLRRKRVMKPSHPVWLPAGLIRGEEALCQEISGGWSNLPRFLRRAGVHFCISETCWGTFLELHARFWSHWVSLEVTPAVTPESKPTLLSPSVQSWDKCSLSCLSSIVFRSCWWSEIRTQSSSSKPRCFATRFFFF